MFRVLILPTLILALLGGLCMFASSARRAQDDQVVFASAAEVHTLDVQQMSWSQDIRLAMGLWEGLLTYDPITLKPSPGCAALPEVSADRLTYTFKLRRDLKWSNGQSLTAADFANSWQRAIDPNTGNDYIELFFHIAGARDYSKSLEDKDPAKHLAFSTVGIKVLDPLTLQVHLENPCSYFPDLAAFAPLFPVNLAAIEQAKAGHYDWTHPPHLISNGPYVLKEWKFKNYMLLEPNPYYYDRDKVHCKHLKLVAYQDQDNAALLAYQSGVIDVLSWLPQQYIGPDLIAQSHAGERKDVFFNPVFGTYYYVFNCGQKPFDDPRVRQAFNMTIDKEDIVHNVTRMEQRPINVMVPPDSIPGYTVPTGLLRDPAKARELLAAAGFPRGKGFPDVDLLYTTGGTHGVVAQAVGQMWEHELGVHVIPRGVESKEFHNERTKNHHFSIARGGWYGDYPDPTTWLDLARTGNGNNDGQYSSPAFDALMTRSDKEPDPAKRFAILQEAEKLLVEKECAFIPLYQYSDGGMYDPSKIAGCESNVRQIVQFKYIHRVGR
jgi:oligopeptide transport system substrate-binding protein